MYLRNKIQGTAWVNCIERMYSQVSYFSYLSGCWKILKQLNKVSLFSMGFFFSFSCFSIVLSRQHRVIFRFSSLLLIQFFCKTCQLGQVWRWAERLYLMGCLSQLLRWDPSCLGNEMEKQESFFYS